MATKALLLKRITYASAKHVTETKLMPIFIHLAKQGLTYANLVEKRASYHKANVYVVPELEQYSHKITNILEDEGFKVSDYDRGTESEFGGSNPICGIHVNWEDENFK